MSTQMSAQNPAPSTTTVCPACGNPLAPGVLEGQCAACLLRVALEGAEDPAAARAEGSRRPSGARRPLDDLAGRRFGRYRLVERLGEGGMGVVYRATDTRLGRPVAFKLVAPERVGDPAARERFEAEARAASALEHPNVCPVYDVGDSEAGPFLVLPLYEGETVAERLERGPLAVELALDVVRQTAEGLARAHREGIVHGDVKPENLMLTTDGLVKILDFGLAGMSGERGRRGGTDAYLPPEAERSGRLDPRADLYALGVVLGDVLLGRPGLAEAEDPAVRSAATGSSRAGRALPALEPGLDALLSACLEPDPGRRIASAQEVLAALERIDTLRLMVALGELPSPDAVAGAPRAPAPSRRATAAGAVLLTASLALAGWLVERWDRWSGQAPSRSVASLLEVARAAAGVSEPQASEQEVSVRWGFALDRSRWAAGADADPAAFLWWRAARVPLVGSPMVVRALDLGRVGPDEPRLATDDVVRVAVALDGAVTVDAPVADDRAVTPRGAAIERMPGRAERGARSAGTEAGTEAGIAAPASTTPPAIADAEPRPSLYGFDPLSFVTAFALLVAITSVLARHNLARGQGDRRGAARLSAVLGGLFLVSWVAGGGHSTVLRAEFSLFVQACGLALFYALLGGLFHLALEPRLRRRWPHVQIGWSRLFAGRLADGAAARELLAGSLLGVAWFVTRLAVFGGLAPDGERPGAARVPNVRLLEGPGQWMGELANSLGTALALGLGVVVVMALVRERTKLRWLAPLVFAALVTPALALTEEGPAGWAFWPLLALSAWWVVGRFGALALVASYLSFRLLWMGMLTLVPRQLGFGVSVGVAVLVLLLGLGPMVVAVARSRSGAGAGAVAG